MPLYDFICKNKKCSTEVYDKFQAPDDKHDASCPECGKKHHKAYSLAGFVIDFRAGLDPGLGVYLESARQRNTYADKHNLRRVKG